MKKSWVLFSAIMFISFASAQGISEILDSIDQSTMILYATFIISFCVLFFSLSKTLFKDQQQKVFAAVISATISLLIVYGVNQTEFDISGFFLDLGVSEDILLTLVPLIIAGGVIFLIVKFAKDSLIIIGGFCIALGFFVEEKTVFFVLGGILIITRLFIIPKNAWMPSRNLGRGFSGRGVGI